VVKAAQRADSKLIKIIHYLENENAEIPLVKANQIRFLKKFSKFSDDGLLLRYVGPKEKPWEHECMYFRDWLPVSLISQVIAIFHDEKLAGHLGIRKTYLRIEERVYWEGMRKDVTEYVRSCIKCQESFLLPIPPSLGTSMVPEYPWKVLTIDLMGPYPKGTNQNQYLFVVVESFTKFVEMFLLRKATSGTVIQKLWTLCCRWGFPKVLISDNGTQFTSKEYTSWCTTF